MAITVGMISLGCPKNQIDAEHLLSDLDQDERFEITGDPAEADAIVINTCAFIESAKKESIDTILEFAEEKGKRLRCIAVTGCLAERYRDELAKELPEVDVVLGIGANNQLGDAIAKAMEGEKTAAFGPKGALCLDHDRILTTPQRYAYLKIADGCDNNCTYCAIPSIRGHYRSRRMCDILDEAHWLARKGVRELIVVAQDTTRYGADLYDDYKLPELLGELAKLGFLWIRLLYLYPERITDRLLDVIAREPRVLPYFDIPIQHINDEVLKKMNRHTNGAQIRAVLAHIRKRIPSAVLRTTLIAGFPGETEEQFAELMQFVREAKFDRLGCFAYSQEEGTPAAKLPGQLDQETKARRAELVMLEQQRVLEEKGQALVGKRIRVLTDGKHGGGYIGRSAADAPDIDCNVFFTSKGPIDKNGIVSVQVERAECGDLYGVRVENGDF